MGSEKREEAREADEKPGVLGVREIVRKPPRGRSGPDDPGASLPAAPVKRRERGVEETNDLRGTRGHVHRRDRPTPPAAGLLAPLLASHPNALSEGRVEFRTRARRNPAVSSPGRSVPQSRQNAGYDFETTPGASSVRPVGQRERQDGGRHGDAVVVPGRESRRVAGGPRGRR